MDQIKMIRRFVKSIANHCSTAFENIPEDKRTWVPDGKTRSATDILNHLTYWNLSMVRAIEGQKPFELWDNDWVAAQTELHDPASALEKFNETNDKFNALIKNFNEDILDDKLIMPYGNETKFTIMLGNLSHNNYHWGQLMFIQRLLGDDKDPE